MAWKFKFTICFIFLKIEFLDRIWDFVTVCRGDHVWTHKAARRNFELDSWSSSSLFALLHLRSFFHFLESWINHDSARGNSGFDTKTVALETTVAIFRKQGLLDSVPFTYLDFRAKNVFFAIFEIIEFWREKWHKLWFCSFSNIWIFAPKHFYHFSNLLNVRAKSN